MDSVLQGILIIIGILLGFLAYWILRVWWINHNPEYTEYKAKYRGSYICVDGHKVRSLSECLLDNTLHRWGVPHQYEDYILKNLRNYKYDFYLPENDLYIEFFGCSGEKYARNTEEKKKFYQENNLKMVALVPEDLGDVEKNFYEKLAPYLGTIPNGNKNSASFCPKCGESLDQRFI